MEKRPLPTELTFKSSNSKMFILLLISIGFVAAGFFLLNDGSNPIAAWLCIGLFGLGVPVFSYQLIKPGTLILSEDGFEQKMIGRLMTCRWENVSEFTVRKVRHGFLSSSSFIMFSRDEDENHALAGVARAFTGSTGQLGDTFGEDAEDLAEIMNAFRNRALIKRRSRGL